MTRVTPDRECLLEKSGPAEPEKKKMQGQALDDKCKHQMIRATPDKECLLEKSGPAGHEKNKMQEQASDDKSNTREGVFIGKISARRARTKTRYKGKHQMTRASSR
jgi:hypothetical protein